MMSRRNCRYSFLCIHQSSRNKGFRKSCILAHQWHSLLLGSFCCMSRRIRICNIRDNCQYNHQHKWHSNHARKRLILIGQPL